MRRRPGRRIIVPEFEKRGQEWKLLEVRLEFPESLGRVRKERG